MAVEGINIEFSNSIIKKLDEAFAEYAEKEGVNNTDYAKKQLLDKLYGNDGKDFASLKTVQDAFHMNDKVTHSAFSIYVHLAKALHLNLNYLFSEEIECQSADINEYFQPDKEELKSGLLHDPGYSGPFYGYLASDYSRNEKRFYHFSLNIEAGKEIKQPSATLTIDFSDSLKRTYTGVPYLIGRDCLNIKFEHTDLPRYEFFLQYIPHKDGKLRTRCGVAITSRNIPTVVPYIIMSKDISLEYEEICGLLTMGSRGIHIPADHLNNYPELQDTLAKWKELGYLSAPKMYYELKENTQAAIMPDYYDCNYSPDDFMNVKRLLELRAISVEFENIPMRYAYNNGAINELTMQYLWKKLARVENSVN